VRPTGAALSYGVFPSAMRKLITSGLIVDEMKKPAKLETFGPVLTEQQAKDPKLLSALMQAVSSPRGGSSSAATGGSSSAAPGGEGSFKLTELKDRPGNFQLTLTKPSTKALNFCFREESNLKGTPVSSDDAYIESNLSSGGLKPILLASADLALLARRIASGIGRPFGLLRWTKSTIYKTLERIPNNLCTLVFSPLYAQEPSDQRQIHLPVMGSWYHWHGGR
jgi:hypothetical protein